MIDISTKRTMSVSTDGDAGPYIVVPVEQIDAVCALLDANSIRYWVDDVAISLDGKPEVTVVNLGHEADPVAVQQILDTA